MIREIGTECKLNVVLPDTISFKLTARTKPVPCDQAIEVVLEAHGLWYEYRPDSALLRVGVRRELDAEAEAMRARDQVRIRLGSRDDTLPQGREVDIDFKDAPLRDLITALTGAAQMNFVLPDTINGKATVRATHVRWDQLLPAILRAHGLWYRYPPNGKIIRIATQRDLDAEDEAELARRHH